MTFLSQQPGGPLRLLAEFDGDRVELGIRLTVQTEPFTEDMSARQSWQNCFRYVLFRSIDPAS